MALISKTYTFSNGATIVAAEHNTNNDTIYNDYNGNITNANISGSASIADTKLMQITTASKVSGAALSSLSSTPSLAGVLPAANVFSAGMIILWSGTIATIPTGFVLCNGSNSTPDLRNLFVVCADADVGGVAKSTVTGSALQSGGSTTISTGNLPAHTHTVPSDTSSSGGTSGRAVESDGAGTDRNITSASTGSGTAYTQPFYALAYIMKT